MKIRINRQAFFYAFIYALFLYLIIDMFFAVWGGWVIYSIYVTNDNGGKASPGGGS